jgi:hypothetical protein
MTVLNNQKWCSFIRVTWYGGGDAKTRGGRTIEEPLHGVLRVTDRPEATWYDYKPTAGYSGPDAFTIEPGSPGSIRRLITVDVKAPPAT